jgi:benzoyl-CoA reductase/2-hydroxyglutaryl-CoA dehydratase subunit BcrC/BadD/HgdB
MELVHKYLDRIVTAKEKGKWVATHGTQQPLEIYEAMDVMGLFIEFWGVMSDAVKLESVPEAIGISTSTGTPKEVCSFFRYMDGLMHVGKWPHTDFLLYATSSCDNVKAYHTLGRRYGIPSFGMERPYYMYTPQAMEHWKNEHKRLIAFLEEKTGKKLDYDRLKETVRLSYRLTEIVLEIDKLVAHVPSPMSAECFGGVLVAMRLLPGTQDAVDYLTGLRDELQERVDNGIAAVENERFRVIWSSFTPFWDPTLLGYMQQKYAAVTVGEVLANWRGQANWMLDPDDPLGNLAYKSQLAPGNCQYGPSQDWSVNVVDQARRLKADGAIFNNNWGCKQASGLVSIVRDELIRHCGVPSLTLDCDVIDATFTTRAEVEAQLDSFFEMIETSKAYKDRRNMK